MNSRFGMRSLNQYFIILLAAFILGFGMQSCGPTRLLYERPSTDVDEIDSYRMAVVSTDTSSMARVAWQDFFEDSFLESYIDKALIENIDMQIALENIKITNAYLKQANVGDLPTLFIGPAVSYSTNSLNTQFGAIFGERLYISQYELSGTLSWEADIWGKIASRKKAELASYLGSLASRQAIQSQIVASVADVYFQLLELDAQEIILEHAIQLRSNSLETAKALKESGQLTEAAIQQYEAQVYNAQAQIVIIDNNIIVLENAMNRLLGRMPQPIERSSLAQQHIDSQLVAVGVPVQLLQNRPDVIAAEYDLIAAFELTNVARANFYPSLTLSASGGLQSIHVDDLFNVNSLFFNLIGSLTQPIWNRRQLKTQKEIALAQQQMAYLNYRKTLLTASGEVTDVLSIYQTQEELEQLKTKEFEAYAKSQEYSEELLDYGLSNYLDVLVAEQSALSAKLGAVSAEGSKLRALVQLYRALGGGWE